MLKDLLTEDRINVIDACDNWEDAIKIATLPLVNSGKVSNDYINEIVQNIYKYGTYIILADGFALPHGSPGKNVNETSLSLLHIKKSVKLINENVNTFLVLATTDSTSHIDILKELSEILLKKESFNILVSGEKKEILELLNNKNKKTNY
ncbi:PTS sugar transporter subunit IIA [Oceanivirga salmonicida]|uniref:PTS sugar transporter subunit IIA n=1 Tax=Oceanivirga salmonicida TaxID=1769291 RepID=UPI0012E30675|nr:PTS sugar transporter subunit IIA [Oceanivirga salmonicida]